MIRAKRQPAPASGQAGGRFALLAIVCLTAVTLLGAHASDMLRVPLSLVFLLPLDLAFGYIAVVILLSVQRPNRLGKALAIGLPCGVLAVSWTKLAVLGTPAVLADLALVADLARTERGWVVAMVAAALLAIAAAFVANLGLQRGGAAVLLSALALVAVLLAAEFSPRVAQAVADRLPLRLSHHPANGHLFNALAVQVDDAARRHELRLLVGSEPPRDVAMPSRPVGSRPRSVHIVVVESLADPLSFTRFPWPPEPLSDMFSAWRANPPSTAVVPVFGNRSSNTEFEVLCGVPAAVGPSEMVFLRIQPGARLTCLPAMLAEQGYRTLSLVPNSSAFFAAGRAFRAMGFGEAVFARELDMADLDGVWLSAESTLSQARRRILAAMAETQGRPVFSYTFVNAGHHPFHRNRMLRPDRLVPAPDDTLVRDWANAQSYNASAVEEHVAAILAADPAALIVVLGDHNPPLGPDFAGYRRGGRIAADERSPLQRAVMYETPLLILDAGRLVPAGRLPAWHLPMLVLDLLTDGASCAGGCPHREPWRLRPFRDVVLAVEAEGTAEILCPAYPADAPPGDPCRLLQEEARLLRVALARMLAAPGQ